MDFVYNGSNGFIISFICRFDNDNVYIVKGYNIIIIGTFYVNFVKTFGDGYEENDDVLDNEAYNFWSFCYDCCRVIRVANI